MTEIDKDASLTHRVTMRVIGALQEFDGEDTAGVLTGMILVFAAIFVTRNVSDKQVAEFCRMIITEVRAIKSDLREGKI